MKTRSVLALARRSVQVWIGIMLLGVGSLGLLIGGIMLWEQRAYRTQGRQTEGTVLSKDVRSIRGRGRPHDYWVRYRFTAADDRQLEDESHVSRARWQQLEPGQQVRIEYLASWHTSRLAGDSEGMIPGLIVVLGGLVAIGGLVLGASGLRQCQRQARAMMGGQPA